MRVSGKTTKPRIGERSSRKTERNRGKRNKKMEEDRRCLLYGYHPPQYSSGKMETNKNINEKH